jgi:hypothetical protein
VPVESQRRPILHLVTGLLFQFGGQSKHAVRGFRCWAVRSAIP